MTIITTGRKIQKFLVLQSRKYHLAVPLLLLLVTMWLVALPRIQANGVEFSTVILLGSTSLMLLAFAIGYLQRVEVRLDGSRNEFVWVVHTLVGTNERRFKVDDIAEFGVHRTRVKRGYAVKPAILFKSRKRPPFPLLTVSISGDRAAAIGHALNQWMGIEAADLDLEIAEAEA